MAGEAEKVTELEGQVTDLEAQIGTLTKQLETITKGDDNAAKLTELTAMVDEMTKALEDTTTALEAATADKAQLEAVAKLSPAARAHYDALAKADESEKDKEKKKAPWFLNLKDKEKDDEVKKSADNDESVVIEGQTIRKSAVGDGPFTVMKAQAERIAKNEKDLAVETAKRQQVELKKKADDEYPHVPGTVDERADMLAAIEKMADPLKKSFLAVFTQSEKLAKAGFNTLGSGGGKDPSKDPSIKKAAQDFETKVSEIKKRDSCSRTQAMSKARNEHPDLYKAYQGKDEEGAAQN